MRASEDAGMGDKRDDEHLAEVIDLEACHWAHGEPAPHCEPVLA